MSEKKNYPDETKIGQDERTYSTLELTSFYGSSRQYSIDETHFIPIDIYETHDSFVVEVEIPGASREDIKVSITDEYLVIEGTKQEKMTDEGKVNFLCMERSFGPFRRTIKVEKNTNKENIKANYSRGILFVKLPKREERRKKIRWISIEKEEN